MMVGLAGWVLEKVTGKSFETLVREEIFEPLRMTSSSFTSEDPESLAESYAIKDGQAVKLDKALLQ
jgi:CubicO group peptidase (beta-lactamase class C family)